MGTKGCKNSTQCLLRGRLLPYSVEVLSDKYGCCTCFNEGTAFLKKIDNE